MIAIKSMLSGTAAERCLSTELQRLEHRDRTLQYIRDMRELLHPLGVGANGPSAQSYRDRWSKLCRSLCDDRGRPQLQLV
jgi:hypothetical protein